MSSAQCCFPTFLSAKAARILLKRWPRSSCSLVTPGAGTLKAASSAHAELASSSPGTHVKFVAEELLLWKTSSSPDRLRWPLLLGPLPLLPRPLRPFPWGTVCSYAGMAHEGHLLKTPLAFPGPSSKQTSVFVVVTCCCIGTIALLVLWFVVFLLLHLCTTTALLCALAQQLWCCCTRPC